MFAVADHADARMSLIVQRMVRGVILRGFQQFTPEHPVRTLVMDLFTFGVEPTMVVMDFSDMLMNSITHISNGHLAG